MLTVGSDNSAFKQQVQNTWHGGGAKPFSLVAVRGLGKLTQDPALAQGGRHVYKTNEWYTLRKTEQSVAVPRYIPYINELPQCSA